MQLCEVAIALLACFRNFDWTTILSPRGEAAEERGMRHERPHFDGLTFLVKQGALKQGSPAARVMNLRGPDVVEARLAGARG